MSVRAASTPTLRLLPHARSVASASNRGREVAQRVLLTTELNAVRPAALARTTSERERQRLGIHSAGFYDG